MKSRIYSFAKGDVYFGSDTGNGSQTITITPGSSCPDSGLTVSITRQPTHGNLGTLVSNAYNFTITYNASNDYAGPDSFTFQVANPCGNAARFIVPITVTAGTNTPGPFTVVTNIAANSGLGPAGMAYSPTQHALIVSDQGGDTNFNGDDFVLLSTDTAGALTVTNFSGIAGLGDEVKLAVVEQSTNGFTNGSVYFGSTYNIGWLSDDGSQSNLNWCILTNNTVANSMYLRGGLYFDQAGVFSNKLIALASNNHGSLEEPPQIWLADSNGNPTLLTQIQIVPLSHTLEGVISLPDNTNQWGPWAGKILTGDENAGILYTVATNGTVTPYDLGIAPDEFALIPTNQDLYICDLSNNRILKLSGAFLTNYAGDLLITQEGESGNPPGLVIVNWDGTKFVTRSIVGRNFGFSHFEHVTFAPLNLPSQPIQ